VNSWIRRRDHHLFINASSLLICGLLAGVIVAAAAFPVAALSGLTAKAGSESFESLPGELKETTAAQVSRAYAADGKTPLGVFYDEYRNYVPLTAVSPNMVNAIVAAEDHNFYHHNGVDLRGVARAFVKNNQDSEQQQGASTLTMQVVRMTLRDSATSPQDVLDATAATPKRKIAEMKYAIRLEQTLSKPQILERYLNAAPFGNGAYGIQAASQVYFGKKAKDLTVAESALLAGMVKSPTGNDPTTADGNRRATGRRDYIVNDMLSLKYITAAQAAAAKKVKVSNKTSRIGNGCVSVSPNDRDFFCDYFYRWFLSQEAFGKTPYERGRQLKTGGYRIVTTLDIKAQTAARKNIKDRISDRNKNALLLAAVEPGTGRVRALAANRKYGLSDAGNGISSDPKKAAKGQKGTYPNTTNPLLTGGGDINGYQAGSVFKMFTMVAALEKGYPLAYPINAPAQFKSQYHTSPSDPSACDGDRWCPTNASASEAGVYNMWTGFGNSVNTYFVPLEQQVGAENVVDVAKRFGVQFLSSNDKEKADNKNLASGWGAFTLGVSASTPLDMANAYATLAGDGMYCNPTPVQQITTQKGQNLDIANPHCSRAVSADVARAALDAARCPIGDSAQLGGCHGSTESKARGAVGHPIFGKTGTTDGNKTASLIVGTTSMVVAGYLVNPDYANHHDGMQHDIVNPAVYQTLADYMKGKPSRQFKKPGSSKVSVGDERSIPDVTCKSIDDAKSAIEAAGFTTTTGQDVDSTCPAGTAAGTSPDGRTVKNGIVSIEVSKGTKAVPTKPAGR
jgi:membrane peptidoglycan carboxypeptidase